MGSGYWSTDVHDADARARAASGRSAFAYTDHTLRNVPRSAWKVHDTLNPLGVTVRESRDSEEHPESLAIAVFFDVTGSMGDIPRELQLKLPELLGLLVRKGVEHPQILFGAVGDANCDKVPLQVGQFESDNRMEEHLANIAIEGGGGGQVHETYELAAYFMARHTAIDCWDKRRKKGYLFTIGDEMPYPEIVPDQVKKLIGDTLEGPVTTKEIFSEVAQRYNYFHIIASGGSHGSEARVEDTWRKLLGERVLRLDDPAAVCETIAVAIRMMETGDELDDILDDLSDAQAKAAVKRALINVPKGAAVAKASGTLPNLAKDTKSSIRRL